MKRIPWLLAGLLLTWGCGKDPTSSRLDQLQQEVDRIKADNAAQRQELLARLDQIAVTQDDSAEVVDIRAKLAQTTVTAQDLQLLQARVSALEAKAADWSRVEPGIERSVYAVLYTTALGDSAQTTFLATTFAVDPKTFITNGHVVAALNKLDGDLASFNRQHGTKLVGHWVVVQNMTTKLANKVNYFTIGSSATHPGFDPQNTASADVALMRPAEGTIIRYLNLASASDLMHLRVGQPIATLGFPGELQGGNLNDLYPIATFKDGTISALRPPESGHPYSVGDSYIVQHNFDLSGGTSGSPIFDMTGKVVAINSSGISEVVRTVGGTQASVSQAALGFGIRADKIHELLDQQPAAKPVVGAAGDVPWLEGRSLSEIEVVPYDAHYDLGRRLEAHLGLGN